MPVIARVVVLAVVLAIVQGCAGGAGAPRLTGHADLQCPAGFTVTCEVRTTGRIHHGTFGKNYDACACVPDSSHGQTSPVIP